MRKRNQYISMLAIISSEIMKILIIPFYENILIRTLKKVYAKTFLLKNLFGYQFF